jgi:UDP:flavonoid glycosyltransferase YjiC (YdhE family)
VLDATNRTPKAIRDAVHVMLTNPTSRGNAQRERDAMMTLPGPEHGVTLLEKLAIERTPVMAGSERALRRAIAT